MWLDKCYSYSALYRIPDNFRVDAASINLEGRAAHWFQSYKYTPGFYDWQKFIDAVIAEFEVDTHCSTAMELSISSKLGL